jgi:hypothetical protein
MRGSFLTVIQPVPTLAESAAAESPPADPLLLNLLLLTLLLLSLFILLMVMLRLRHIDYITKSYNQR